MKRKLLIEEMKKEKSLKQKQQELNEHINITKLEEDKKLEVIEESHLEYVLKEKELIKKYIDEVDKKLYENNKQSWYNYFWSFIV